MAEQNSPDYFWDKSLQELQDMVREIYPEEEKILERVRLKGMSEHKNEATRRGKNVPKNITIDGLIDMLNYDWGSFYDLKTPPTA